MKAQKPDPLPESFANQEFSSYADLKKVIINSYDAIFVIDGKGTILLCNPATGRLLDTDPQKLIGKNVEYLIETGIYDRSIAMQAAETGLTLTGLVTNRHGIKLMCTATPIFDEKGAVSLVPGFPEHHNEMKI